MKSNITIYRARCLRKARTNIIGCHYLITAGTDRRTHWFENVDVARAMNSYLLNEQHWLPSRLIAWVLMPDHWHGIIVLGERMTLASVMQSFKGRTSRLCNDLLGRNGRFWQAGYHDHLIFTEAELENCIRYVFDNPVRAGLVERSDQWPYSGSVAIDG